MEYDDSPNGEIGYFMYIGGSIRPVDFSVSSDYRRAED